MVNDRQVLHQLARNCKAGLVSLIRLGQSMQIRPLEIANSKAGLIVLDSLALAWLLPKLESIIFMYAHGSVHTSARRLLAEIDNPP